MALGLGAVGIERTPNDPRDIEIAAARIIVQGARYPENIERMSER